MKLLLCWRIVVSDLRAFIEHKCPNGVRFQRLGDIATLVRGNGLSKKQLIGSDVGAIHYGQIYTKYSRFTTTTISRVDRDIADKLVVVNPGDVIVACTSENMEDVCTPLAWLGEEPIVTGGHTVTIRHRLDPKYLVYWLGSQAFQRQKRAIAGGVKVIDVAARKLATVMVPVPPLEVQSEIVKVLDRFTQLKAELEAELEARKAQFSWYDHMIFPEEGECEWLSISDVAKRVSSGGTPSARNPDFYDGGTIPWLRTNEVRFQDIHDTAVYITESAVKNSSAKWIPGNCVIVAISGASAGRSAVNAIPVTTNQHCCNIEVDEKRRIFVMVIIGLPVIIRI